MKKFRVISLIIALILVMGLYFSACSTDSGDTKDKIVYTSKDASGNIYRLTITQM